MGAGALAEETLVPAAAVVAVDPALPLDHAALLGCAVITGVGAVLRTAVVRSDETVLVIGCGGVGLGLFRGRAFAGQRALSPPTGSPISFRPRGNRRRRHRDRGGRDRDRGDGDVSGAVVDG